MDLLPVPGHTVLVPHPNHAQPWSVATVAACSGAEISQRSSKMKHTLTRYHYHNHHHPPTHPHQKENKRNALPFVFQKLLLHLSHLAPTWCNRQPFAKPFFN